MKGYGVLALLVSVAVLSFPPMMLQEQPAYRNDIPIQETTLLVRHADEDVYSDMDIKKLALYETAAQIAFDAPIEAVKAQAVACYTLLCYQQLHNGTVESTALSFPSDYTEDYWKTTLGANYEKAMNIYRTALSEVDGKRILCEDQPIMALSHACNGGVTENGDVLLGQPLPYLTAVASSADALSTTMSKTVTFTKAEATKRLTTLLGKAPPADVSAWFGKPEKTTAGTVQTLKVCGQTKTGYDLQKAFSLPSASFDVAVQGEQVTFTVRGQGHLVGMSVCGAIAMANDGQTYEQILKYYYTGVTVE